MILVDGINSLNYKNLMKFNAYISENNSHQIIQWSSFEYENIANV